MKKSLLVILALFAVMTVKAQWYVGGGFSAEFFENYNALNICPDFGYTFENVPFTIGISPEFDFQQDKFHGDSFQVETISLSPYLRYYFYEIDRFSLFTDLIGSVRVFGDNGWDIGLSSGVSFDLTEHWSAEFCYGWIGYEQYEEKGFSVLMDASTAKVAFYYNF